MERELLPKESRILEAAAELIGENHHAIRTLKVADIANRAGVGKGTVYEYFSSKEEIIQKAVCLSIRRQMDEAWTAALSKGTFRE
ncbi:MAG: TetR/AcrR family transcriptional regulator, partial [Clostridia bacterium]